VFALANQTPLRVAGVPEGLAVHVVPPFVVFMMTPLFPTATPVVGLVNHTPISCWVVPDVWVCQSTPFVVCMMAPESPTTQPLFVSVKCTALHEVIPPACCSQLLPASVVRDIAPLAPTAHPVSASTKQVARHVVSDPCIRLNQEPPALRV